MTEHKIITIAKEVYGSHTQWYGQTLQRLMMLMDKIEAEIKLEHAAQLESEDNQSAST